jgi:hypothetical protein
MELRNHSVMFCDGIKTWPPRWLQTYGNGTASVTGEIGILSEVFLSQVLPEKIYLVMNTAEGNSYLGSLIFEKRGAAKTVFDLLRCCINQPLTAVGGLDLPEDFAA